MSNEQEKVSQAFLKAVIQAEAADVDEPEEVADPSADRVLAERLAIKYAVDERARVWFRRPKVFAVIGLAAAAAAALLVLQPTEPTERTLTVFTLKPKATDGTLGATPASSVISLVESRSWEITLEADAAFRGNVTSQAFLSISDTLHPVQLHQQRVGSNLVYKLTADLLPTQQKGPVLLQFVTCRSESLPSARKLRAALLAMAPATAQASVRLPTGDCQLNSVRLELASKN